MRVGGTAIPYYTFPPFSFLTCARAPRLHSIFLTVIIARVLFPICCTESPLIRPIIPLLLCGVGHCGPLTPHLLNRLA